MHHEESECAMKTKDVAYALFPDILLPTARTRLYAALRKEAGKAGWMKEEPPGFEPGECQNNKNSRESSRAGHCAGSAGTRRAASPRIG